MVLEGEITKGLPNILCSDCRVNLPLKVCKSAAGYYIGYWCPICGPYGRESGYYRTEEEAEYMMKIGAFGR